MVSTKFSKASMPLLTFAATVIVLGLYAVGSESESNSPNETLSKINSPNQIEIDPDRTLRNVEDVPIDIQENMDPKLIDFVVAGFPKCGTTYLQNKIMFPAERIFIPHHETHFLANDKYEEFKEEFANVTQLQQTIDKPLLSGYKAPFELGHQKSIRNLVTLFPDVRMIITLRHPVLQFESLYNYKLRKLDNLIPPVEQFVGQCMEACLFSQSSESSSESVETRTAMKSRQHCLDSSNITFCTGETNYHQYLSRLGLTPMNTNEELDLLDHHKMSIHHFPGWERDATTGSSQQSSIRGRDNSEGSSNKGRLFLIEIGQYDNRVNQSMADDLVSDLEDFLGLDTGDLPRMPPRNGEKKPHKKYEYPEGREEHVLDICLDRYTPLREVLLETSRKASQWIMEYLLHPSNRDRVIVSNMDIFRRMVEGWKTDPCSNEDENSI